jgi:hypothetical protein
MGQFCNERSGASQMKNCLPIDASSTNQACSAGYSNIFGITLNLSRIMKTAKEKRKGLWIGLAREFNQE